MRSRFTASLYNLAAITVPCHINQGITLYLASISSQSCFDALVCMRLLVCFHILMPKMTSLPQLSACISEDCCNQPPEAAPCFSDC